MLLLNFVCLLCAILFKNNGSSSIIPYTYRDEEYRLVTCNVDARYCSPRRIDRLRQRVCIRSGHIFHVILPQGGRKWSGESFCYLHLIEYPLVSLVTLFYIPSIFPVCIPRLYSLHLLPSHIGAATRSYSHSSSKT